MIARLYPLIADHFLSDPFPTGEEVPRRRTIDPQEQA